MSSIHERLNIKVPIWSAGMGIGIAGATLTSTVSNAGGLGVLGLGSLEPGVMHDLIAQTRKLTRRAFGRSEEHTSELQSRSDLVCRLLLEKKKHPT